MSIPTWFVRLVAPFGAPQVVISDFLDQSSGYEYTSRIEEPGTANRFSAPQMSFTGYDTPLFAVFNILQNVSPQHFLGPSACIVEVRTSSIGPYVFYGSVLPETIQLNTARKRFSFTAVDNDAWLASTGAGNIFRRNSSGWQVSIGQTIPGQLVITKPSVICDILPGDEVQIGNAAFKVTVSDVQPATDVGAQNWRLYWVDDSLQYWPAGTLVAMVDQPARNLPLKTVVDGLLEHAGRAQTTVDTYAVQLLSQLNNPFRSGLNLDGLFGQSPTGLVPNGTTLVCSTSSGSYQQFQPPTGQWIGLDPGPKDSPVDFTNRFSYSTTQVPWQIYGALAQEGITFAGPMGGYESHYYCYKPTTNAPSFVNPAQRAKLTVTWLLAAAPPYTWSTSVDYERSFDGESWNFVSTAYAASGTTSTDLRPYMNQSYRQSSGGLFGSGFNQATPGQCFGIDMDEFNNYCAFIEIYNTGAAGSALGFRLSSVNFLSTGTTPDVLVSGVRGAVVMTLGGLQGILYLFFLDSLDGNIPHLRTYDYSPVFINPVSQRQSHAFPAGFLPYSLKLNRGFSTFASSGLAYSDATGLDFYLFANRDLTLTALSNIVVNVSPPPLVPLSAYYGTGGSQLAVVPDATIPQNSGVMWPCAILSPIGPLWFSFKWSEVLDVVDLAGLSCGDALAQLATLVNGIYYPDPLSNWSRTWFRTRNSLGAQVGTGANILDYAESLADSVEVKPSWIQTALYVRVTNDKDETIFGEAGDPAYRGTPQGMELSNRFCTSKPLAGAVAQFILAYFEVKKRTVSVPLFDDGRAYYVGNRCNVAAAGGAQFQIVEVGRDLFSSIVKVTALEL